MIKSIAVVAGSYLLSVVLVMATNPLLSRIFPGQFADGQIPSTAALLTGRSVRTVMGLGAIIPNWSNGWPHWYWLSWLFSWPVSCWIGLLLGRRCDAPAAALA